MTTTLGLPSICSESKGAKKLAHFAEPPVSEKGMVHSIVLPLISAAFEGIDTKNAKPIDAPNEKIFDRKFIFILLTKKNDFENTTNGELISLLHYDHILLTN